MSNRRRFLPTQAVEDQDRSRLLEMLELETLRVVIHNFPLLSKGSQSWPTLRKQLKAAGVASMKRKIYNYLLSYISGEGRYYKEGG